MNDTIILTGHVASPADAQRAIDIAKGFAAKKAESGGQRNGTADGSDGNVINALMIRGDDQVMLKVTVAEVSRTVLKQLGVSANPTGARHSVERRLGHVHQQQSLRHQPDAQQRRVHRQRADERHLR